ncbi:MAG TPA: DUF6599 family protein [Pyrinomonadaceae bacterium]
MRFVSLKLITVSSLLLALLVTATAQTAEPSEISKLFPKAVGAFRAQAVRPASTLSKEFRPEDYGVQDAGERAYLSRKGEKLTVTVVRTYTQAGAYALLSELSAEVRSTAREEVLKPSEIGVTAIATSERVVFYKGTTLVSINGRLGGGDRLIEFARAFAQTLEDYQNDIPVLVKHLPDWGTAQDRATYALSLNALQRAVGNQAALDVISFAEGTEAVTATYDASRLIIVEYTTPQLTARNDARIMERIKQLHEGNQPVPTAYRRVGNYSVFVYNAPDEAAARQLIDQVKYEQQVQWLGENPFALQYAAQQHTQNTQKAVSLILGIAKTIGFFVALCLGAGGVVGGIAFLRRRAQQRRAAADIYSDAGGMLRLNLDEMTPQTDPARLLSSGDGKSAV